MKCIMQMVMTIMITIYVTTVVMITIIKVTGRDNDHNNKTTIKRYQYLKK